jgi:hypothetical protein
MTPSTSSSAAKHGTSRSVKNVRAGRQKHALRRTTITLSPESQEIVERFKSATGASASAAIDQIIRRSEPNPSRLKNVNGLLVLDSPDNRPKIHVVVEDIKRAEDELDREYVERSMRRERALVPRKKKKKSGRR